MDHGQQSQPMDVDGLGAQLAQMLAPILTAQNSCPVHEQCDSSCPNRVGVKRYMLMPNGERRYETDERALQLNAVTHLNQPPLRTQPLIVHPDTPKFTYLDLPSPHSMIRLLRLKKAYFRADPVDAEIATFHIEEAPSYGALSYCWGTGPDVCKMLCNGQVFYARASLERALKRLRAGFNSDQAESYLWADAICINQENLAEKGAQIQLMERIYSEASTVYIDLGDTDGHVVSSGNLSAQVGGAWGMGTPDTLIPVDDASHPFLYKTIFLALRQPWFTRTWVIQEAALARRAVYMFCGNVISQSQLDGILSKDAMRADPNRMQELIQQGGDNALRGYLNYAKLQQIKNGRRSMGSLEIMELTRDFAATDPADKVFGLSALMNNYDRRVIGPYPQPVEEVFRRFAALQVRRGFAIKMLDNAGLQRSSDPGRSSLPSWVPDWMGQNKSPKQIAGVRPVPYMAAGFTEPRVRMIGDDTGSGGLSLRGMVVDAIETVVHVHNAPLTAAGEPSFLAFHDKFRSAFDNYVNKSTGDPRYMDNEEAFARLLLMDDTYTGRNALLYSTQIDNPAPTYRAALAAWREGHSYRKDMGGGRMDAVQTFQMQAATVCPSRGFATTRGEYIGLVPPVTQVGDLVVVFYGATVPYVVRKVRGGYALVGDAFVHGFMCGEALERRDLEPVDIVLV
ncbi:hypothetical protein QQS21_012892 [Conoideocrella luteorostrata]|uniref:Heterokaryon incompatibility domain-containing protein n=1 Tax=Conoideocrella luteorostrata TaxID=1105319 RepID=A0AAJ0CAB0_9HYPO|nr:hypothetical protein QQS21_012892 [Conoideocrella luteorostrata]